MSTSTAAALADLRGREDVRCPRCGELPARVYPPRRYTYGTRTSTVWQSWCRSCRRSYASGPRAGAPARPARPPQPRRRPLTSWSLPEIIEENARLGERSRWHRALVYGDGRRWTYLRSLVVERAAGRCELAHPGCTADATHVAPCPPRSEATPTAAALRAACRSCHQYDIARRRDRPRDGAPLEPLPAAFTISELDTLTYLDDHDVPRHFGRRAVLDLADAGHLPGLPSRASTVLDVVTRWRRATPPAAEPPRRRESSTHRRPRHRAVVDVPRSDVADVIAELDRLGVPVELVPGDVVAALADAGIACGHGRAAAAQRWRRREHRPEPSRKW